MPRCRQWRVVLDLAGQDGQVEGMLTPGQLELVAQSLTAVLSIWLGLTVLTRSRSAAARVFGFLCLVLVAWSTSTIIEGVSTSSSAVGGAQAIEALTAALIIAATAHFALVIATDGHPAPQHLRLLALAYGLNLLFVVPGILNHASSVGLMPSDLSLGAVPGPVLGWSAIAIRLATLFGAAAWVLAAFRRTHAEDPRRRQLGMTLLTLTVGMIGGILRVLSQVGPTDPWIGLSLIALAMVLSAYVVFSTGVFFGPEIAGRAFWTSLAVGLGVFFVAGALLAVDAASRDLLGLDQPLFLILALVITIALYEPVVTWGRARIAGRTAAELARGRLVAAVGPRGLASQAADAGVQPALDRVTRALGLAGAVVARRDGSMVASYGPTPDPSSALSIELLADGESVGELRITSETTAPRTAGDDDLLRLSATYLAAALRTGRREDEEAEALTDLAANLVEMDLAARQLNEALIRRSSDRPALRVFALGPLRVERGGIPVERWGGEKAGTRQAEGLFAFLFDRGERGVAKDEALDLIWPDTEVDRADLAFHRTLGGLRHVLDPDGDGKRAIRFHNDRYRLDPSIVSWSDVALFLERLDEARDAPERAAKLHLLEAARVLYRGEYLDDCPFYGDSVFVEDRRASLRDRLVDLLTALGEGYESSGDRASAADAYRQAVAAAGEDSPAAQAGLARLVSGT